jgi:hypothetical protein
VRPYISKAYESAHSNSPFRGTTEPIVPQERILAARIAGEKEALMQRDIWTVLAAVASVGFLGWVVVATPDQSALRGDPDRPLPR